MANYEPCSICEEYIEGVICDKGQCPVGKMKAENERLKTMHSEMCIGMNVLKKKAYKECLKKFEKNIKDVRFTLGQTWEIKTALKQTLKEMAGEDNA